MTKRKEEGVVLAMVLVIVAGIAFIGYETMRLTRLDLTGSSVLQARLTDEGLLDAGLVLAKQLISEDDKDADSLLDSWNYLPERSEALSMYFTSGELTGGIEDENSRFPVNMLRYHTKYEDGPYGLLSRLLEVLVMVHGMSGSHTALADEIFNWVNAATSSLDDKYLSGQTPLRVPHKPMKSIDELLLLQWPGSSKEDIQTLYYGTDEIPGLKDLLTPFTTAPINMNTADKLLLFAATKGEDMALRSRFVTRAINFRGNPHNSIKWAWYDSIIKDLEMTDQIFVSSVYGYKSEMFRVFLTAKVGSGARHALAIIERKDDKITVVRTSY